MKKRTFRHIVAGEKVISLSTYRGKEYKGIATCSEIDDFDIDLGIKIADARCNIKIAKKRMEISDAVVSEARNDLLNQRKNFTKALEYQANSSNSYREAVASLNSILNK